MTVAEFYDGLSVDYHLLFADWEAALVWQPRVLEAVLRPRLGPGAWRLLDATCGIGTQALGLAARGHRVFASDLSPASVQRLLVEARARDLELEGVAVADLRDLARLPGGFDAALSCDNALPHLEDDAELARACAGLRGRLRAGGWALATIRDYDATLAERPAGATATPVRVLGGADDRRMVFQVWDWAADGERYAVTQMIVTGGPGAWSTRSYCATYRALRRSTLSAALVAAGFVEVSWHLPEETGYYQPLVLARAP
jgi:SAM-dependent methyltransferase